MTALLLALAIPLFSLELGPGTNKGIPQDLEGVQGSNIISDAIGDGAIAPTAIVVDTGRAGGVNDPEVKAAVARLFSGLGDDPEVASIRFDPSTRQYVDTTDRYLNIQVIGTSEYGVPEALDFDRLRDAIVPAAGFQGLSTCMPVAVRLAPSTSSISPMARSPGVVLVVPSRSPTCRSCEPACSSCP